MAEVTFDEDLGGDGSTVSDDANPDTGLQNGGHRTRFIPALIQTVAMILYAKGRAIAAAASAALASDKAAEAAESADAAAESAEDAIAQYQVVPGSPTTMAGASALTYSFSEAGNNWKVDLRGLYLSSGSAQLRVRVQVASADDTNTSYSQSGLKVTGTATVINENSRSYVELTAVTGGADAADKRGFASVEICCPEEATQAKVLRVESAMRDASYGLATLSGFGGYLDASVVTGITIYPSTGTMSGKAVLLKQKRS